MAKFQIAPSRLARYYYLECDRFLRFDAASSATRRLQELPDPSFDTSPVTRAILASGEAWEQHVLQSYLDGSYIAGTAAADDDPVTGRVLSFERTLEELATLEPGTSLYQPTLRAPDSTYAAYGLDRDLVGFGDTRPDLLTAVATDRGLELRVVDLKASDLMQLSHRIQVGVYTILLNHVLRAEGLADRFVSTRTGGVWLYQEDSPQWFPLASIIPPIEMFLRNELTPLLEAAPDDAFWHLNHRCEWCDFSQHCHDEATANDDVSLVPYLSHFGKRHLQELDVETVDGFAALLDRDDAPDLLTGSASLEGRHERLQRSVTALRSGEPHTTGASSVAMPRSEGCRLTLTIHQDPLTGEAFGYAINRLFGSDVFGNHKATVTRVAERGSADALRQLRADLVNDLVNILGPIHRHNRSTDVWREQLSVQVYVYDSFERELLVESLIRVLEEADDVRLTDSALRLLFHFQHPDMARLDEQPAQEVLFPVVVLTDVIRALFALPIPVTYRFADVNQALQPSQYGFTYHGDDYFDFDLSNRMRSDAILKLWSSDHLDRRLRDDIQRQLQFRVWGANSIVNGIREALDGRTLFAYPPRFSFPDGFGFDDPVLSRLAFISQYESVLGYLERRAGRTGPLEEQLTRGDALEGTWLGDGRVELHPRHTEHDVRTGFMDYLLTTDSDQGRRARLAYDDFRYRRAMWAPKNLDLALVEVQARDDADLRCRLTTSDAFRMPQVGDRVLLDRRFMDWTTHHVIEQLGALDTGSDDRFVDMLRDPVGTRRHLPMPAAVADAAAALATEHDMTPSQQDALAGLLDHDLQLVWGPPGTGKTHFLAMSILCLAEAHRRAERPLSVLITAFTHTAIDNVLQKIQELQEATGIFDGGLPIVKLASRGEAPVRIVEPKRARDFATSATVTIAGATVWQVRKVDPADLRYDLVVIDEGSQVMVGQAAIPLARLAEQGRLLIAGDDQQLPPIIQGAYPEEDDQPHLHRSILECLRRAAGEDDHLLTTTLVENWRMNDVLCRYPAASIYPESYSPATDAIRDRRLDLEAPSGNDFASLVLDPDFPAVVCVLEDVKATAENEVEAALVADVACALRDAADGLDDEAFWRDRLFIVSPHHVQIRAVQRALRDRREWDTTPFVDTVDKMQGQECDAVIVSYGVADVEYALREGEFIYSLNRLNVAYTRARAKSIVFLPRPLLEPPIQALESERTADGIAFMQGLANWLTQYGETHTVDLGETGSVTVMRA